MTTPSEDLDRIAESGIIAVMRGITDETVADIGDALVGGGITAMEVTADTPGAVDKIARLADRYDDREVLVGAGTVLDDATAQQVITAGATFIVCPTLDEGVIRTANRYGTTVIPGVFTPTEALEAMEAGADAVKVFPAASVGPGHLAAIRGPLEQIPLIPTGGVNLENGADYIDAGAIALGVGSALVSDELVDARDWTGLEERAEQFVRVVEDARA